MALRETVRSESPQGQRGVENVRPPCTGKAAAEAPKENPGSSDTGPAVLLTTTWWQSRTVGLRGWSCFVVHGVGFLGFVFKWVLAMLLAVALNQALSASRRLNHDVPANCCVSKKEKKKCQCVLGLMTCAGNADVASRTLPAGTPLVSGHSLPNPAPQLCSQGFLWFPICPFHFPTCLMRTQGP